MEIFLGKTSHKGPSLCCTFPTEKCRKWKMTNRRIRRPNSLFSQIMFNFFSIHFSLIKESPRNQGLNFEEKSFFDAPKLFCYSKSRKNDLVCRKIVSKIEQKNVQTLHEIAIHYLLIGRSVNFHRFGNATNRIRFN